MNRRTQENTFQEREQEREEILRAVAKLEDDLFLMYKEMQTFPVLQEIIGETCDLWAKLYKKIQQLQREDMDGPSII